MLWSFDLSTHAQISSRCPSTVGKRTNYCVRQGMGYSGWKVTGESTATHSSILMENPYRRRAELTTTVCKVAKVGTQLKWLNHARTLITYNTVCGIVVLFLFPVLYLIRQPILFMYFCIWLHCSACRVWLLTRSTWCWQQRKCGAVTTELCRTSQF